MKREVYLTRQAEIDLDTILTWIGNRSTLGAASWLKALESTFAWLEGHAASCPLARESDSVGNEVRERLFKTKRGRPYRLLFAVTTKQVQILHIRGPGQDLVSRL